MVVDVSYTDSLNRQFSEEHSIPLDASLGAAGTFAGRQRTGTPLPSWALPAAGVLLVAVAFFAGRWYAKRQAAKAAKKQ
jgi:type VI protein secretion system component VasF